MYLPCKTSMARNTCIPTQTYREACVGLYRQPFLPQYSLRIPYSWKRTVMHPHVVNVCMSVKENKKLGKVHESILLMNHSVWPVVKLKPCTVAWITGRPLGWVCTAPASLVSLIHASLILPNAERMEVTIDHREVYTCMYMYAWFSLQGTSANTCQCLVPRKMVQASQTHLYCRYHELWNKSKSV